MAYQKSYVDLDMLRNQLLNAVLHTGATAVIDAALTVAGQIGFDTTLHRPKYYSGSVIREIASLDGSETLTNKTLTSPVINTQITGDAIVTYAGGGIAGNLGDCSDLKVPSEKAVFSAIASGIGANDAMIYKGAIDCTANPFYPAADAGHTYKVSLGGKIGGDYGPTVEAGDTLICTQDGAPEGMHDVVGLYWTIIQYNVDILPTSKGGTGSSLQISLGDMLFGDSEGSRFNIITPGAEGTHLMMTGDGFPEWTMAGVYDCWVLKVNMDLDGHGVYNNWFVNFEAGSGIALSLGTGSDGYSVGISLNSIAGNSILANATASAAVPSGFSVNTSGVVGRLATGNITNIPFGTLANTVAWGDHTHSQLHDQVHAIVGPDHTASGLSAGQIIIATGASAFAWSTITLPNTASQGDILFASATNSWTTLAKGTNGQVLSMVSGSPQWANPGSSYSYWTVADQVDTWNVLDGYLLNLFAGNGLVAGLNPSTNECSWIVGLATISANSIMANATASAAVPSGFSVNTSGVVGRLATGNITNIPFGTLANTVAWGDHTHSQLHDQVHAIVGPDHTASGLSAGQIIIATGASAFAWSTITLPNAATQGDILFASATNTWATLAKSPTTGHFLRNSGSNNNPAWGAITLADMPAGTAKYYVASFESGGSPTTTITVTASTHGCGLKPMVQFIETNGSTDYRVATAQIIIDQATGDVTVNTNVSTKGKVIIIGS